MSNYLILRVVTKLLMPFILLYALYVQFHGDYGPGGGFQAGVIFGSGLILYALIFGTINAGTLVARGLLRLGVSLGVLLYAGVGVVNMLMGGEFLNYSVLADDPAHGQHYGILLIELGVGITVAAVMVTVFFSFAAWQPAAKRNSDTADKAKNAGGAGAGDAK